MSNAIDSIEVSDRTSVSYFLTTLLYESPYGINMHNKQERFRLAITNTQHLIFYLSNLVRKILWSLLFLQIICISSTLATLSVYLFPLHLVTNYRRE